MNQWIDFLNFPGKNSYYTYFIKKNSEEFYFLFGKYLKFYTNIFFFLISKESIVLQIDFGWQFSILS